MGLTLSIVIPVVLIGYAAFLVYRHFKNRRLGRCSCGGCSGCPMAGSCQMARQVEQSQKNKE